MLDVAEERESEGDLCLHDLGTGLPFRNGTFDGAISISAVQWLCNAVRCANPLASCPFHRCRFFFSGLSMYSSSMGELFWESFPPLST